jgi:hypothetical protein
MYLSQTYGLLKHGLMQKGVYIPSEVASRNDIAEGIVSLDSRKEITFAFCEDFFVKTFLSPETKNGPKVQLHDGQIMLRSEKIMAEVDVVPLPRFLKDHLKNRNPVSHNIQLDGNCLNLFLRSVRNPPGLNMELKDILSVIQSAFEEGVADLVQLNMDYNEKPDRDFSKLDPVIKGIRKSFRTFISLRGFPPDNIRGIDSLYASGIDLINFPLEGFARSEKLEALQPRIRDALKYAVDVFPQGAVSTELELGPTDQLKEKIDQLGELGIAPHIKLPEELENSKVDFGRIEEVSRHLTHCAHRDKLTLKWLYPTASFVTPLDASFFVEDPKLAKLAVRPLYQSMLGRKTSEGFTALRRKLRVRNIDDSFESAGL